MEGRVCLGVKALVKAENMTLVTAVRGERSGTATLRDTHSTGINIYFVYENTYMQPPSSPSQ